MNRKNFGLLIILATLLAPIAAADMLRCESDYGRRHECTFSGWGRIALSHQLSKTACIEGRTWGRNGRNAVWVSDGCRADFLISRDAGNNGYGNNGYGNRGELITCPSQRRFT